MDSVKKHAPHERGASRRKLAVPVAVTALIVLALWALLLAPRTLKRAEETANTASFSSMSGRIRSIVNIFKNEDARPGLPEHPDIETLGARVFGDAIER
ncbi:MAG: hypothetical protein HY462_00740 [Parcubacteria group bacterium]|nr:hypothetical protein [Parcubacteria group bacterium]